MLTGKTALVTGGGKGIGRAIAITLAGYGAQVAVNYNGSEDKAKETVKLIEKQGGKALSYRCDVADGAACKAMIDDLTKSLGHLDILVNNAGITRDNLIMKMSEEDFDAVLSINLKGAFHTCRHLARQLIRQRGGRIVNISSVSGVLGNAGQVNYSASKAGLIGLTKSLARELASRSITVNAVAPGFIDTDMTQSLPEAGRDAILNQIPLKRIGEPWEIAEAVAFLASDKAAYITGQVISVDGGMAI